MLVQILRNNHIDLRDDKDFQRENGYIWVATWAQFASTYINKFAILPDVLSILSLLIFLHLNSLCESPSILFGS